MDDYNFRHTLAQHLVGLFTPLRVKPPLPGGSRLNIESITECLVAK